MARRRFAGLETTLASLTAGESGLDAEYEAASEAVAQLQAALEELARDEQRAQAERAALAAKLDGLALGLERKDGSAALLAASDRVGGLLGSVAALVSVRQGYETAVSAALGAAADAVAVTDLDAAVGAFGHLKAEDLGRAGLLLGTGAGVDRAGWPALPSFGEYAVALVECGEGLRPAIARLLFKVAVVPDLEAAAALVADLPDVTAVTRDGDLLSTWFAAGGSSAKPSLLEVQAAVDETRARIVDAQAAAERARFAHASRQGELEAATNRAEAALARLHESDAQHAALAEELAQLSQTARASLGRPSGWGRRSRRPPPDGSRTGRRWRRSRRAWIWPPPRPRSARPTPATGTGSPTWPAPPAARRWTPGSPCAPPRSGPARWPAGPTPCSGPPTRSGGPASRRLRAGSRRGSTQSMPAPSGRGPRGC